MEQSITTVAADSSVQCNEEDFYRLTFEDKRSYLASLPPADNRAHRVVHGDTLWAIAAQNRISLQALI